jgi:S1-C subfamily serine protease
MERTIRIILLLGLIFNLAALSAAQQKKRPTNSSQRKTVLTPEQIAQKFLPSVVLIVCDDGKGNYSQGSGFYIDRGLILTNYHVINDMIRGKVKIASAQTNIKPNPKSSKLKKPEIVGELNTEWWINKILYTDLKNDLALLSVIPEIEPIVPTTKDNSENKKQRELPVVDGTGVVEIKENWDMPQLMLSQMDNINIGEKVYVLSNPLGLSGTISQGIISGGLRKIKGIDLLQIDAPISSGSSGGAVLNAKGEVIGIATGSFSEGQNLNFAVPSSQIKTFLKTYETDSNNKNYTFAGISKLPNAWLKGIVADLKNIKPIPKVTSGGDGFGEGNQNQKTEEAPKLTYEEIVQDLVTTLKSKPFKAGNSYQGVTSINFSKCSMNLEKVRRSNDKPISNEYKVNIKNVKDFSFTTFSQDMVMSVNLNFERNVVEKNVYGEIFEETPFEASFTKEVSIPVGIDLKTTYRLISELGKLKELCGNAEDVVEPSLQETTSWLTEKVEGTELNYGTGLISKYELLQFSQCRMSFAETLKSGGLVMLNNTQPDLKFLTNVEVTKNTSGNWGIWLEFGRNFDLTQETFGHLGKREYSKIDKITIFQSDYEKAKRVGSAFIRLLELCGEETKEPF